jgi:hypothetical protein
MSLSSLPKDVLQLLAMQLSAADIARLGLTCKSLSQKLLSLDAEPLWQRVAEREAGKGIEKRLATWRETVADLCTLWSFTGLPSVPPPSGAARLGAKLKGLLSRPRPPWRVAVIGFGKSAMIHKLLRGEALLPGAQSSVRQRALITCRKGEFALVEGDAATLRDRDWAGLSGVILMVDCNARDAVAETASLVSLVVEKSDNAPLLVFCNKQDMPNALGVADTTDRLGLHNLRGRYWYIQSSAVFSG